MARQFVKTVESHKTDFFRYLNQVAENEKKLLVRGNLIDIFHEVERTPQADGLAKLRDIIEDIQESVCLKHTLYMEIRETVARSDYFRFNLEELSFEPIDVATYLKAKESYKLGGGPSDTVSISFKPFYDKYPSVRHAKSIGSGVEYLNRYLSSQMFTNGDTWRLLLFNFLQLHKVDSRQLILNDRITGPEHLTEQIEKALAWLHKLPDKEPLDKLKHGLQEMGFEVGLGSNAELIQDNLRRLSGLMDSPDHQNLKDFISRIPMIFNIVIVSVHGYFAQEGVLGLPDTGGQVVYILDQVKALERTIHTSLRISGLDITPKILILTRLIPNAGATTCNQRLEKVYDTKNTWILRVPFRPTAAKTTENWISRFEIYPYLEDFAEDAHREILAELGRRPDLVIGNYTDGNLVATILAREFKVTQCNIAHALEKSKYLYAALYWKELEEQYHFSLQFTADLIAMNSADFLITSSYQEIAGTETTIGQYESYKAFSMPELFRVESGINLFHPKFNVVSPGVNDKVYFSYIKKDQRLAEVQSKLETLLFGNADDPDVRGTLDNPHRTPIFTMARLDKIKNLTALVRWFGASQELRTMANLIVVAGNVDPDKSSDKEEREQIDLMHGLMNEFQLHSNMRWIGKVFRKDEAGEVYRLMADRMGVFVQPALFEGFGLTVLEAMASGLPVFATQYGGPSEIIEDGRSGFHLDPINDQESTEKILRFVRTIQKNKNAWLSISKKALTRVHTNYNWRLYSDRLLSLSKIYGFWKYALQLDASELYAYLDVLFHLLFKPMARDLLKKHDQS